uniref:Coiled-coil domain-containing protein 90A, mitochondrial n=1 Tax=Lygus hesperus TaxID=30085 RepID=A0A0A9Y8N4_LYGHE
MVEYDYDTLVEEMKKRTDRRIKAINYVWTKDVKNVLCDQLHAIGHYDQKLRDTVQSKIDNEMERTKKNENHLKLLIQGLEEVRIKMIKERYATNMCIAKQQTEELNYLIQESYDRTINELKASNMFNFNLTQIFFMRSTENDISLVHELHSEQKRVEDHVKMLRADVEDAKKELIKLEGPLEDEERMAKWMETTIAALQKDMRSKKDQERTNSQMVKDIGKMEGVTTKMQLENAMISLKLANLENNYEEIRTFKDKYQSDNPFNMRMRQMRQNNEEKIINLKRKLREEFHVTDQHLKMLVRKVDTDVARCKLKRSHNLLETKAFNELVTQFDLRAREHQMKAYIGIDKLAIPYRKTSANIITTFNEKKKVVFPYNTSSRSNK